MSRQWRTDTESPNHWWAFSWTTTYIASPPTQNTPSYTGLVWSSIANSSDAFGTTTPPCASNGYGPNRPDSQSRTSLVRSTSARAAGPAEPSRVEYALTIGRPLVEWSTVM